MKKLSKAERSCYMPESINGAQTQIHASSKALSIVPFALPTYFKVYCNEPCQVTELLKNIPGLLLIYEEKMGILWPDV